MITLPSPAFDANATSGGKDLGRLPEWDLSDLYTAPDAPELARDLDWLEAECARFAADYEGKLATLDADGLWPASAATRRSAAWRGGSCPMPGCAITSRRPMRAARNSSPIVRRKITNFTTPLVFFSLELNRLDADALAAMYAENADLARYEPVIRRLRAMKPYQLSDEIEKLLHDLGVVGDAWERLFDETISGLTFTIGDEEMGIESTLTLLTDHDRDRREAAARELARVFGENVRTFARVHNTQAKEKEVLDRWRGMPSAQTGRHLANDVEPEVVAALRDAVVAAYPRLSHRYYELKRKWLGLERMQVWDRNAPLPMEDPRTIPWDEARETVSAAYAGFDPKLADLAAPFFEQGWIDAA